MAKLLLFVVLALSSFASNGDCKGLIDLGGIIAELLPNLNLAIALDRLISPLLAHQILARPIDTQHVLTACEANRNQTMARNGLSAGNKRWYKRSDGTWFVPIVMDPAFTTDEKNTIFSGLVNIQDNTCMRFYTYNEADLKGFDYVRIQRGSGQGCYSNYIGRAGVGKQIINLQPNEPSGCIFPGTSAHEMLHAIGFDHQQNAPGRNDYVTINFQNIESGKSHNFNEDSSSEYTSFGAAYDYDSVMHYGEYDFSSNGQKTISVKKSGAKIGQRKAISSTDAYKVQKMHGC